jgi:hypothetical protein
MEKRAMIPPRKKTSMPIQISRFDVDGDDDDDDEAVESVSFFQWKLLSLFKLIETCFSKKIKVRMSPHFRRN